MYKQISPILFIWHSFISNSDKKVNKNYDKKDGGINLLCKKMHLLSQMIVGIKWEWYCYLFCVLHPFKLATVLYY